MDVKGSETTQIKASAERVYKLLIDLSHIGEVSPSFTGAEWMEGATGPHAGAHFMGHTASGDIECRVLRAMPGEEWAYKANLAADPPETWRYTFEHTDDGSIVTVKWDAPTPAADVVRSLAELKRLAEA